MEVNPVYNISHMLSSPLSTKSQYVNFELDNSALPCNPIQHTGGQMLTSMSQTKQIPMSLQPGSQAQSKISNYRYDLELNPNNFTSRKEPIHKIVNTQASQYQAESAHKHFIAH